MCLHQFCDAETKVVKCLMKDTYDLGFMFLSSEPEQF